MAVSESIHPGCQEEQKVKEPLGELMEITSHHYLEVELVEVVAPLIPLEYLAPESMEVAPASVLSGASVSFEVLSPETVSEA